MRSDRDGFHMRTIEVGSLDCVPGVFMSLDRPVELALGGVYGKLPQPVYRSSVRGNKDSFHVRAVEVGPLDRALRLCVCMDRPVELAPGGVQDKLPY